MKWVWLMLLSSFIVNFVAKRTVSQPWVQRLIELEFAGLGSGPTLNLKTETPLEEIGIPEGEIQLRLKIVEARTEKPIPNVELVVEHGQDQSREFRTDQNGICALNIMRGMVYEFYAYRKGYKELIKDFALPSEFGYLIHEWEMELSPEF